ncbi:MAG: M48 family metalloprotease [Alphaproteobacteria bacterium]
MLKKILMMLMVITVSACGAVLKNPHVNDKEFQRELANQKKLLKDYQNKHKHSIHKKQMQPNIYAYDNYFGTQMDRMLVNSSEFCKNKMYTVGIRFTDSESHQYDVYGLTPGFPAQKAGIRKGDKIISINGSELTANETFEKLSKNKTNTVTYLTKNHKKKKVTLNGLVTCQMFLVTSNEKVMNAMADGNTIYMFPELYNFLGKNDYINTVIAHEIAHNIMSHRARKSMNSSTGQLIGLGVNILLGGNQQTQNDMMQIGHDLSQANSPEFEAEADYMGLYIMKRAGYNINNSPDNWRRMTLAEKSSDGIGVDTSHPSNPKRFVAIKKAVKEINRKAKNGQPLVPDFQKGSWAETMNWGEIKNMQKPLY